MNINLTLIIVCAESYEPFSRHYLTYDTDQVTDLSLVPIHDSLYRSMVFSPQDDRDTNPTNRLVVENANNWNITEV